MARPVLSRLSLADVGVACALRSWLVATVDIESRAQGADDKLLMRPNNVTCFGGIA